MSKRLAAILLFLGFCLAQPLVLMAQDEAAPVVPMGGNFSQYRSGMVNYGWTEHTFSQFTGESAFSDGQSPTGIFSNLGWDYIMPLNEFYGLEYPKAWSAGAEWLYFSTNSEGVLSGKGSVVASNLAMDLNLYSFSFKAYFADVHQESIQFYAGTSWGLLSGTFTGKDSYGNGVSTAFSGLVTQQTYGAHVMLTPKGGLIMEYRPVQAREITTNNDPYNRGNGTKMDLDFSGAMINFFGYLRF